MTTRAQLEKAAQQIAHLSKVLLPGDCSFCVLAWGPDVKGQQWSTYVHNTEPAGGGVRGPVEMHHKAEARRNLAQELRRMADVIESRADLPPGVAGHG